MCHVFIRNIDYETTNGSIGNGSIIKSHNSPMIGNRYVKRPEPIRVASMSSSTYTSSSSNVTFHHSTSLTCSDKDYSSISSTNSDKENWAKERKQDALFNEMLQKAPKNPQR